MNMSAVFITRPVATTLLMAGILIFGLLSYMRLPLNDMPNVEFPYIIVIGEMSGADPETMATSVAKPLEKQISGIAGIKSLKSTNKQGRTMVMIEFELDRDIDGAALDVQSAISQAYSRMPDTMTEQPRFIKINPDSLPVLQIALTSRSLTPQELTQYAETYISQRLSMVNGVSKTEVRGAKRFAVRVQLDPALMVARDVSVEEISSAVQNANVTLPTGTLEASITSLRLPRRSTVQAAPALRNSVFPVNKSRHTTSIVAKDSSPDLAIRAEFTVSSILSKPTPAFSRLSAMAEVMAPSTAARPPVPMPSLSTAISRPQPS